MRVSEYVASFERFGRLVCGMPCGSSISGVGYDVGEFDDGTVLRVGDRIVYTTDYAGPNTSDLLAKVGRLLTGLSRETRAAQLAGLATPRDGRYTLDGTVWTDGGEFVGLV